MKAILQLSRKKYSPPGMNTDGEKNFFIAGNVLAFLFALMAFILAYANELIELYEYDGTERIFIEGKKILDFHLIYEMGMTGFLLTAAIMLIFIIFRYTYYFQGSKSIYLMKRLPKKAEIHKRALIFPISEAFLSIVFGMGTKILFFVFYLLLTPKEAIPEGQLENLFRFI